MPILEGSQKGYSNDIPTEFHERVGEEISCENFDEDEETESWPFRELVGGLMWLAISTRPDISNAVRSVARYCSAPKAVHWKSALGILAYINVTCGFGTVPARDYSG